MALDVYTAPGFVFVTCGGETVVVAGVLVPPPGLAQTLPVAVGQQPTTAWFPASGVSESPPVVQEPVEEERRPPPSTGRGRGGISTQVKIEGPDQFVSLALLGQHGELVEVPADPLNKLLSSDAFCAFNSKMAGSYALTVSPRAAVKAENTSVAVSKLAPSVVMKYWSPNV